MEEEFVLKIRIKFAKIGPVKYVGHLDMLRYFQKLIRRADIAICYSEGFNPHQKMSFASPLGVGVAGEGEYVDIEVHQTMSSKEAVRILNQVSVEGILIKSYRMLPDGTENAMSSVAAADYFVKYREGYEPDFDWKMRFDEFMKQTVIEVEKETKKSTAIIDIRPFIYDYQWKKDKDCLTYPEEKDGLYLKLATGSVSNIKPELVFTAYYQFLQKELPQYALDITRLEVYKNIGTEEEPSFFTLESFGDEIA